MKLRHPFFSPVAMLGTLLLLGLVGAKIHYGGGLVFSPGELSDRHKAGVRLQGFSAHAEFENDCAQCHEPWQGVSAERCLRCHAETARQIKNRSGLHGALEQVNACASCHVDHRGRQGTMPGRTLDGFDHRRTGFKLDGAHAGVACARCHPGSDYRNTPTTCVGCHVAPDGHDENYGVQCAACHATRAWLPARWDDHPFPLNHGDGEAIACATCHPESNSAYTCYGCHEHSRARMVRKHREEQLSDSELDDCLACHHFRGAGGEEERRGERRHDRGEEGEGRNHEQGGND